MTSRDRIGGASGLVALAFGAAGGAMERGWPSAKDPAAVARFIADHRGAILAQSMLMMVSALAMLWFFAALRARLRAVEDGHSTASTFMFGAAVIWVAMSFVAQAFQIGTTQAPADVSRAMLWTMGAMFSAANLPLAGALLVLGYATLRERVFSRWLGVLALAGGACELLLWSGTVITGGPLAPDGWLGFVLYPAIAVWLVPTAIAMMRRPSLDDDEREPLTVPLPEPGRA